MVKQVVGEETRLQSAEDRLSQSSPPVEAGLIVGNLIPSSGRALVYELIPTPPTESGAPACELKSEGSARHDRKKPPKASVGKSSAEAAPSLAIDSDWVAEHARQVSRMLPGGMDVVGVYVWASEASFKATLPIVFSQTIRGVAQASPWYDDNQSERLLIHISYSPRRWACRYCVLSSGNFQPCDLRMGKLLSSLQSFTCEYSFDIRVPVLSNLDTLKNVLRNVITYHAKDLQTAKALVDGKLVDENQSSSLEGEHKIELLLPFLKDTYAEAYGSGEVAGLIVFSGTIYAFAYLNSKEPISQAISYIKGDVIRSLKSRLDIIFDELEGAADMDASSERDANSDASIEAPIQHALLNELRKHCHLSLPRRVLIPWFNDIRACDYLQMTETFEDVKDRCKEMIMISLDNVSTIQEQETESLLIAAKSFQELLRADSAAVEEPEEREYSDRRIGGSHSPFSFLVVFLILLAAISVGWFMRIFGPVKALG